MQGRFSLNDEVNLQVFKPIADVDSPEFIRVKLVEELEAGPAKGAHHGGFESLVHLKGPGATGLILGG